MNLYYFSCGKFRSTKNEICTLHDLLEYELGLLTSSELISERLSNETKTSIIDNIDNIPIPKTVTLTKSQSNSTLSGEGDAIIVTTSLFGLNTSVNYKFDPKEFINFFKDAKKFLVIENTKNTIICNFS